MTSYTRKISYLYAVVLLFAAAPHADARASGPGDEVFASWMQLWKQAPSRFADVLTPEQWKKAKQGYYMTSSGAKRFEEFCDVPEFTRESGRMTELKNRPPEYLISAKKEFSSDAACLAYYDALVKGFTSLLAPDNVKISKRDDHVFFKDRQETFYRRLYVKYYLKDDRGKQPRVRVSVRVEFKTPSE